VRSDHRAKIAPWVARLPEVANQPPEVPRDQKGGFPTAPMCRGSRRSAVGQLRGVSMVCGWDGAMAGVSVVAVSGVCLAGACVVARSQSGAARLGAAVGPGGFAG
jgi:hypothetical protein